MSGFRAGGSKGQVIKRKSHDALFFFIVRVHKNKVITKNYIMMTNY